MKGDAQKSLIGKLVTFPLAFKRGIGIVISAKPGPGCQQYKIMAPSSDGTVIHGPFMSHELSEADAEIDIEIKR
jgi:hypothetical protein